MAAAQKSTQLVRPDLKDYCPASNLAFNEKITNLINAGEEIFHFGFGQAPFPVLECMCDALKEHAGENAYLPVTGIPSLREAICEFHQRHGALSHFSPDYVIVGPGTKELIFLMACVFSGDIMVISPSWTTYKPQAQLAHHQPVTVTASEENSWKITPADLEECVTKNNLTGNKILIMCNPDNPTGTSYDQEDLKAIADVCRKLNILVLCDEIYSCLHYDQDHTSLAQFYPEGTILSTGMSKWASAGGWRVGYHMYPKELQELFAAVRSAASHSYSCAPAPMQYAVAQALRQEEKVDDYIFHTTRIMREVGLFCYRELSSIGLKVVEPSAGYYIFPNFEVICESLKARGIHSGEAMCQAIFEEAKVALMAGGPAFLRPKNELTTRLCFVNFNGSEALAASRKIGAEKELPENFVQVYCTPVFKGIQALKKWVQDQLTTQ